MKKLVSLVAAALVATSLISIPTASAKGGCASGTKGGEWLDFGSDLYNTRSQPAEKTIGAAEAPHLEAGWTFSITASGADGNFQSTPAVADGCVYAGTSTGWVFAINAETGELVWKIKAGDGSLSNGIFGLSVARGKVLANVSSPKGPFAVGIDQETGKQIWKSPVLDKQQGAWTNASAKVWGDLLFFGMSGPEGDVAYKGKFAVLDVDSGKVIKITQVISDEENKKGYGGGGIWSTPAIDPKTGFAYVGTSNPYGQKEHHLTNSIVKIDLNLKSKTFGEIVDSYHGDVDQYYPAAAVLADTPVCTSGAVPGTVDHPECGQIDLDFGASPTLYKNSEGRWIAAALQKSGVVHAVYADNMEKAWSTIVGAPCALCNVSSTAFDGKDTLFAAGAPGSNVFGLDGDTGAYKWAAPVADGTHYQPLSYANGVLYTVDSSGRLDTYDTALGVPAFSRPMSADVGDACTSLSGGVAIANEHVYATCDLGVNGGGWLIGYAYDSE
jgi:polyvinyl alcohol dehydrogenase (cytochrome)